MTYLRKLFVLAAMAVAMFVGAVIAQPMVSVEAIGHWHVFDSKTLTFHVTDDNGMGMAGLDLNVQIARAGSDSVTQRSVSGGEVQDLGDGTYTLEYAVSSLGSHAVLASVDAEGTYAASAPIAFSVSKAGEEGVMVTADGTPYVYQIRYVWEPGHVHANDQDPVTLSFEVMRGIPEGDEINWAQPWANPFNHVTDASRSRVLVTSEDGSVSDELVTTYVGRGIYEAQRVFTEAEVGDGTSYSVRLVFTDPYHGAEVTHDEAYPLNAVPAH